LRKFFKVATDYTIRGD